MLCRFTCLTILEWPRNSLAQDGGKATTRLIIARKVLVIFSSGNSYAAVNVKPPGVDLRRFGSISFPVGEEWLKI